MSLRSNAGTNRGPKGRPPNANPVETRRRILDISIDAFAEHGFERAGTRLIAELAGVTPATVYHYFPTKAALYESAYRYSIEVVWEEGGRAAERESTAIDAVKAILRTARSVIETRPAMTLLAIRAQIDFNERLDIPIVDEVLNAVADRALARGELHPERREHFQRLILILMWGLSITGRYMADALGCFASIEALLDGKILESR